MTGSRRVVLDVLAKATDHPIEVHRRTTLIDQACDCACLSHHATEDGAMTRVATAPPFIGDCGRAPSEARSRADSSAAFAIPLPQVALERNAQDSFRCLYRFPHGSNDQRIDGQPSVSKCSSVSPRAARSCWPCGFLISAVYADRRGRIATPMLAPFEWRTKEITEKKNSSRGTEFHLVLSVPLLTPAYVRA